MKKCSNCGTLLITGISHGDKIYCSKECEYEMEGHAGFCPRCIMETTSEDTGDLYSGRFKQQELKKLSKNLGLFIKDVTNTKCPICGSEVEELIFSYLNFIMFARGKYRVIRLGNSKKDREMFFSRRLSNDIERGFLLKETIQNFLILAFVILLIYIFKHS